LTNCKLSDLKSGIANAAQRRVLPALIIDEFVIQQNSSYFHS